jgi:hypothetical protein
MQLKRKIVLGWFLIGTLVLATAAQVVPDLARGSSGATLLRMVGNVAWTFIPLAFGVVGGLIVSQQPRQVIGWLLMTPATLLLLDGFVENTLRSTQVLPAEPSFWLLFSVWFSNTGWIFLIFPVLFVVLLFPTGHPPSPRWRWVLRYGGGLMVFFFALALLMEEMGPDSSNYGVDWVVRNPLGFVSSPTIEAIIFPWWVSALGLLAILCALSIIVRFRRAATVERQQIKWLLYASGLFVLVYVPLLLVQGEPEGWLGDLSNLLLGLALLSFPLAIGIAILRYRLFDIDIIIRKTLVYGLITGLLALVYFGLVVLLQTVFESTSGERSPLAIVISTLVIAALFAPLRRRVQEVIDRRFYRRRYDAQQVLEQFGQTARDETDMVVLTAELVQVVQETMQPEKVSLWTRR